VPLQPSSFQAGKRKAGWKGRGEGGGKDGSSSWVDEAKCHSTNSTLKLAPF